MEVSTMSKKSGFFTFLAGGLIGAAVALLYAPRSGEETRQILMSNSQEIKEKAVKSIQEVQDSALVAIEEAQMRLEALNQETKERFAKLQGNGKKTMEAQQESKEEVSKETSS
jgi:gas vesicle protein